ncbi:MAG: tRNA (adenosine(37)-N6)-threonylcarbamoyltransferase complex transferase subunit TsaD [bacterium]|nr:tRNA (adenosine(37)-N6)-threonylcarbamoyltransferase complex transferase subunit TsaD [bacterium]
MKVLSIETSCDDTGITIMEAKGGIKNASFKVLADELTSQAQMHSSYGGVYPSLAKREHIKNLPILLAKVLKKAKMKKTDAIAVTYGPGLEPCLWTGIVFAQELAKKWNVPIMPVNHMEGHIFSVFGKNKGKFKIPKMRFPVLSLLVSGGHTEFVITNKKLEHKIIGHTLDDAAGEAFDKVARMLGLPYPGGPHISKLAEMERKNKKRNLNIIFPRPMLKSKNLDFSFSGLKTAVLYFTQKNPKVDKVKIALEFENAVVETLVYKTQKAMEEYKTKTLIIGGGVSANKHLQRELKRTLGKKTKILLPTRELARDNAIMIGMAGYLNLIKKRSHVSKPGSIKADGDLRLG